MTQHHTFARTIGRTSFIACVAGLAAASVCVRAADLPGGFSAENIARAGFLSLRTGEIETATRANLLDQSRSQPPGQAQLVAGMRYVLQLDGPLSDHKRALLQQCGITLGDYLPDSAYFADLSHADLSQAASLGFITWAGAWDKSWKLEPEIGSRSFESEERKLIARNDHVIVQAYTFAGESAEPAAKEIANIPGAQVLGTTEIAGMASVQVQLPRNSLSSLADIDSIRFVEESPELTERSNLNTQWIVQSNIANSTPLYNVGIHGEGQIIGIMDGGFQPSHCSFVDAAVPITTANTPGTFPTHRKVVAYNVTLVNSQHGTHVAGTALGNQSTNVSDNTRGIAYNARICFRTYSSPIATFPIDLYLGQHADQGATVHTNSWGDDGTTAYNAICRAIDLFSYNREDNLVCFASTNLTALKNPENAKSVLAVGKSGGSGSQTGSCSTLSGPTADGRRKPEVFAPGCSTISSNSSALPCGTTSLTGTSMASPAVAGAASLVRQYFTDGFYPTGAKVPANSFVPSGALLRAMLVNSAVDMTSYPSPAQLPPNKFEGFGRILLDNSVYLAGDARRLIVKDVRNTSTEALSTSGVATLKFRVNSSSQPLEITMAFTDSPATIPTSFAPVNNIDLRVIDPAGNVYLGNVINAATGQSQIGGSADAINCIENFILSSPTTGQWRAEIVGTTVNVAKQGFALVITGDAAATLCPADFNNDNLVDDADFAIFATAYEILICTDPSMPANCPADLNGDKLVDDSDFALFASAYETFVCP